MMQFAVLLNELTESGTACFSKVLGEGRAAGEQLGTWMGSATPDQVKATTKLLNENKLEEFRALVGVGSTRRTSTPATGEATPSQQKKPWWKFWG